MALEAFNRSYDAAIHPLGPNFWLDDSVASERNFYTVETHGNLYTPGIRLFRDSATNEINPNGATYG